MRSKGRPRTSPVQLRNGFYIEIYTKGIKKGMKIRSETRKAMEDAASQYASYKDVTILGEYKDGMPFKEVPVL